MKKKKANNKFDLLVEKLVDEFIKIPNLDLLSTDDVGNRVFNIITFRISEIVTYKELVCTHFIPATNKAIFEAQKEFKESKYNFLLRTNELDFKETLYDTVRLAYVGLFHKLENYINDVIKMPDLIYGELFQTEGSVAKWAKEKFQFDIKNWQQFYIVHKINWICNCVKHKDGYPIKEPKPTSYELVDESKRIRLTPDDFKHDCDLLVKFYPIYIQTMFIFAQHKLVTEKPILKEDYEFSPDLYDKQIESVNKMEKLVQDFVNHLKEM